MAAKSSNDVPGTPDHSGRRGHDGNGSHPRADDQLGRPATSDDPPLYEAFVTEDVALTRIGRSVTVIVGAALVATLATISIVAIAIGAIPVALTCAAAVLAVSLHCIVRSCFAIPRHRR